MKTRSPEEQARLLQRWLEEPPGTAPPDGLDVDVVEAMYALKPELAPPPSVSVDRILEGVTSGPLARNTVSLDHARRRRWPWAAAGSLAAAAAALMIVLPSLKDGVPPPPQPSRSWSEPPDLLAPLPATEEEPGGALSYDADSPALAEAPTSRSGAERPAPVEAAPAPVEAAPAPAEAAPAPAEAAPAPAAERDAGAGHAREPAGASWGILGSAGSEGARARAGAPAGSSTSSLGRAPKRAADVAEATPLMDELHDAEQAPASRASSPPDRAPWPEDYQPRWYLQDPTLPPELQATIQATYARVDELAAAGRAEEAVQLLGALVEMPHLALSQDAAFRTARLELEAGARRAALSTVERALAAAGEPTVFRSRLLALRGLILEESGRLEEAAESYREANEVDEARRTSL